MIRFFGLAANAATRLAPRGRTRQVQLLSWLGLLAIALANEAAALFAHMRRASDPNFFNDDVRQQIFPFFGLGAVQPFRDDYIAQYYLANFPSGYRAIYTLAGICNCAEQLSKVLPYALLLVVIAGVGIAAHRLSGSIAVVTSAAILLGSGIYLERMSGGLPRAFGYPMVALALAALARGNAYGLAAVAVFAAGFYPVASVIAGSTLGLWLLCLPASLRGQASAWSRRRRLCFVLATGGVCLAVLVAPAIGSAPYGPIITPDRVDAFPEIGPDGRYISADRAPFASLPVAIRQSVDGALFGAGTAWSQIFGTPRPGLPSSSRDVFRVAVTEGFVLSSFAVWMYMARRRPALLRLLILPLVAALYYVVASWVAPYLYLPQRYLIYSVPLCATLFVSTFGGLLYSRFDPSDRPRSHLAVAGFSLAILLVVGGRGSHDAGLWTESNSNAKLLNAIAGLPSSSVVAAWPTGLADFIPYVARRRVFVSHETHQAFHVRYTLEMRRRVGALIAAYAAESREPLIALYRDFGVTHLVVRDEFLAGSVPSYFAPFDSQIRDAAARLGGRTPEVRRYLRAASVYSDESTTILALERIAQEP